MEFILYRQGINLFEEKIDDISLNRWVEDVSDINTKIQKSSSEILSYYRNNLVKLSCSLKYIKKANTRKESESNFRKEV